MINRWNQEEADRLGDDLLALRVYTSQLQGLEEDLVLHGGGNTSVKIRETNVFGEEEEILYVKGSGWDLATIKKQGFAPVKMDRLLQMARLPELSDMDMVKYQRTAMTDPGAPNPSVEAILHAIIPFRFVDHTHADAVVTISNTPGGEQRIWEIYGKHMLIVPYVMPGFILAKKIYEMTKDLDWSTIEGMILLNHGIFTFHDDPKVSYDNMIKNVSLAEDFLEKHGARILPESEPEKVDLMAIARLRRAISQVGKAAMLARLNPDKRSVTFSNLENVREIANRGPLTPDHIIRTKRTPLVLGEDHAADLEAYVEGYGRYFQDNNPGDLTQLTPTPQWAVWPGRGSLSFGNSVGNMRIIEDITNHTMKAIHQAEQLGGWTALSQKDLFEMEYWSLEQAKLKKAGKPREMQARIAIVTGAASGIGKACVEMLLQEGAVVTALDINPAITGLFDSTSVLGLECDVTSNEQLTESIRQTIRYFGGLDLLVLNAGIFPKSMTIKDMDAGTWSRCLDINLTSQQRLLQLTIPYLEQGIDPSVVIVGSKNVPAPGPGASAYSVAKAGLTQLARVAAMELGPKGIRINTVHPNAVYDTAIWTEEVLQARARHYGLTVEEYKTNNVLKREVTSRDVARLVVTMLGPVFGKTTGAQVPIDGGNERII
jgi:rhamnose utilization protein RhaD (predicted bifunctional aldolase and dehydrogenase)/NAD(P)-dependent dehydrogenase (short-subunit alcohol dehydrogenase family)